MEPILQAMSGNHHLTVLITMEEAPVPPPSVWWLEITPLSPRDAKLLFSHTQTLFWMNYLWPSIFLLAVALVTHACQTYGVKPSVLIDHWKKGKVELLEFEGKSMEASINSSMHAMSMMASPGTAKRLRICRAGMFQQWQTLRFAY
jgi:hypothetical protein